MRNFSRLAFALLFALPCYAAFGSVSTPAPSTPFVLPPVPQLGVHAYVLMDARTGQVLAQQHPHAHLAPGGAAKLMTAYVVFQEIQAGRISLKTRLPVSRTAWRQPGTRMFLNDGSRVTVNDLLQGLLVDGGNDAAVTLAQGIGGTRAAFVSLMNDYVHELGLRNTHFTNATGLPAPGLYTSPMDLAKLSRDILLQFPQYAHYFTQKQFRWNGITQFNYDKLLWRDPQSRGLSPGYAGHGAGYCMAAAALHGHTELVAAVMGMPPQTGASVMKNLNVVARVSQALLGYGFRFFSTRELYKAGAVVADVRVHAGAQRKVKVGLGHALYVTVPRGEYSALNAKAEFKHLPAAPVTKGEKVGTLAVRLGKKPLTSVPVVALASDPKGNLWQRIQNYVVNWLHSQKA